ncbi:MAG: hypothetical protein IJT50_02135 [Lentisphaeria bacterium]|nr:hypothetical protein [Lentisphaeria bacterium]
MKIKKFFLHTGLILCIFFTTCTGCSTVNETSDDSNQAAEKVSSGPNALERQGLAFSRILCSPLNMIGFTAAECKNIGGASVILFPFICCWTIPAGAIAMTGDVITGTFEMLFWHQFTSVKYPWDSFDYEVAKPYCDFTKILLLAALEGAAEGAAQGAADAATGGGTGSSSSYASSGSGNGRISGPSRIAAGRTASYSLYVDGKRVFSGVNWRAAGTSISVYSGGSVRAGNPPVRAGREYRTAIEAQYNGRSFRKTITICK